MIISLIKYIKHWYFNSCERKTDPLSRSPEGVNALSLDLERILVSARRGSGGDLKININNTVNTVCVY